MSRPSASVLMISTLLPPYWRMMSPGLSAAGPARFSVAGMRPTTLTPATPVSAMACMAVITAAPPHMSYFMSSMPAGGLTQMPPESKVSPLPTSNTVGCLRLVRYSSTTRQGGRAEPWLTARMPPMPSFCRADLSSTLHFSVLCRAIFLP